MRTALDTNILSALWSSEPTAATIAANLARAKSDGALIVSAPVYAELLAHPSVSEAQINDFLADTSISLDFDLSQAVWLDAGRRYALYAARYRRETAREPKRLLADFIIGSHALLRADRFMTLDAKCYSRDFPELKLL